MSDLCRYRRAEVSAEPVRPDSGDRNDDACRIDHPYQVIQGVCNEDVSRGVERQLCYRVELRLNGRSAISGVTRRAIAVKGADNSFGVDFVYLVVFDEEHCPGWIHDDSSGQKKTGACRRSVIATSAASRYSGDQSDVIYHADPAVAAVTNI